MEFEPKWENFICCQREFISYWSLWKTIHIINLSDFRVVIDQDIKCVRSACSEWNLNLSEKLYVVKGSLFRVVIKRKPLIVYLSDRWKWAKNLSVWSEWNSNLSMKLLRCCQKEYFVLLIKKKYIYTYLVFQRLHAGNRFYKCEKCLR